MEKRKIYPYIIEKDRLAGYYEILLDEKYELKMFYKNKNKEIYNWYLPNIREYLFWSFELTTDKEKEKEFKTLENDLKSIICEKYTCNIFKKDETIVICFNSGICFAITENIKELVKLKKYQKGTLLETINLRDEDGYKIPKEAVKDESLIEDSPELYSYILQLYKLVKLNKIHKEIQSEKLFDKTRNRFVDFTEKLYNVEITDKKEGLDICKKWQKELKLEELYLKIDNEFDLLYKNNKLNYNKNLTKCSIILFIIAIIIGIINLWNMM